MLAVEMIELSKHYHAVLRIKGHMSSELILELFKKQNNSVMNLAIHD